MELDHYFLKKGDTIGVAAPSSRFDVEVLSRGVKQLKSLGFDVRIPGGLYGAHRYLAGSDRERADVLMSLFKDPLVKAIIPVRGGYGAMRILSLLDWEKIRSRPIPFIGFSDASALISALLTHGRMPAFHGPNLVSFANAGADMLSAFEGAVTGQVLSVSFEGGEVLVPGVAEGTIAGGNLATLVHMIGTRFAPDFNGCILFLEDVGEPAYKIDRMLTQMTMAGLFNRIRGVFTGSFENCANPEYIPQILTEIFTPLGVPVMTGFPAGHGEENVTFPLGVDAVLDTRSKTLKWAWPHV